MSEPLRVALVHDWLNGMRGGEKVLEVFCELFPQADLYTLLYEKGKVSPAIAQRKIVTSFVDSLPWAYAFYRYYLPVFPLAIGNLNLEKGEYDLVVSTSHCVAKGVRVPKGALHISYCFTPMRYVWALPGDYFGRGLKRLLAAPLVSALRNWDRLTAEHVHDFVAISNHVAARIKKFYGRDADVVYPPVDTSYFSPGEGNGGGGGKKENFFLVVSALVPYKRIELAIEACTRFQYPLRVIGAGTEYKKLRRLAGPTVQFLGWQPNEVLREQYRKARALIFPGEEDFGIVPLEAMACGTPVIAYGRGGVTETMRPPAAGIFFNEPTTESLMRAIRQFEKREGSFDQNFLRSEAQKFDRSEFKRRIDGNFREKYERFRRERTKA